MDLTTFVRAIPDYPVAGIMFRDIAPLIGDAKGLAAAVEALAAMPHAQDISKVAGIEARGFIFGAALASRLSAGFVALRKPGKLPYDTLSESYSLEYGSDSLEIHTDALMQNERVLLVDDLIATGGTAEAGIRLLNRLGAEVTGAAFVIDLPDLGGSRRLDALGVSWGSLMQF